MKKLISLITLLFLFGSLLQAQTDGLNFQAIIIDQNAQEIPGIDVSGNYLSEEPVSLIFTIFDATSQVEFQEVHYTVTDEYGMVNLTIGQGEQTNFSPGEFNTIEWDGTPKQLEVQLSYDGGPFEVLQEQDLLFVPYAYHRDVYASQDLTVEGSSTLNGVTEVHNLFSVLDGYETYLSGVLTVDGRTYLNSELNVLNGAPTYLSGDLTVDGVTNLNGALNVNNGAPAYFSGDVTVDGQSTFNGPATFNGGAAFEDLTVNNTTTLQGITTMNDELTVNAASELNGQVTITANVDGNQYNYDSYPLRVQGSNQGIAIKVDGGESESKNFLSFYNGSDDIIGRVEGQTLSELHGSYRFIWDVVMGGLEQAFIVAEGAACSAQLDIGEAGVMVVNSVLYGAQWVELTAYYELNVGVNFSSGGADYAEYIEKADPNEMFYPGEVVGITDGMISHTTAGADHVKVISSNPIVLGNMPSAGGEENYAIVGFLGQVPTRVLGTVKKGDYIVPGGGNDGFASAFTPEELPTERFNEIIGVAWEDGERNGVNLINVGVGLTVNDLASRVSHVESELEALRAEMESLKRLIAGESFPSEQGESSAETNEDRGTMASGMSRMQSNSFGETEFESWLQDYGYVFVDRMSALKKELNDKDINYQQFPELAKIVDQPLVALKEMYEGSFMPAVWNELSASYLK